MSVSRHIARELPATTTPQGQTWTWTWSPKLSVRLYLLLYINSLSPTWWYLLSYAGCIVCCVATATQ